MRRFLLIATALALLPALPAAAQGARRNPNWCYRQSWPDGGFCTPKGRWEVIVGRSAADVYFPNGQSFRMTIAQAEVNGADSDPDDEIDAALSAAGGRR